MAKPYRVDPATAQNEHAGEWFLKAQNPPPLIGHEWPKCPSRSCLMGEAKTDRNGFVLTDSILYGDALDHAKGGKNMWNIRDYNLTNFRIERVNTGKTGKEASIYLESYGSGLIEDVTVTDAAANAYQDAWRGPGAKQGQEVIDPDARLVAGTLEYRNFWVISCGSKRGYSRLGFMVSNFEAEGCPQKGKASAKRREQSIVLDLHVVHRLSSGLHVAKHRPLVEDTFDVRVDSFNNWAWKSPTPGAPKQWVRGPREACLYEDNDKVVLRGKIRAAKPFNIKTFRTKNGVDYGGLDCAGMCSIQVDGKTVAVV